MAREGKSPTLGLNQLEAREFPLNYRHHFHAGNFADLLKHAVVLALLDRLLVDARPLQVVDTHAGAGLYDLDEEMARRSGEAEAGIGRLLAEQAAPPALMRLSAAVAAVNAKGAVRLYPGSPLLIAGALRRGDGYTGYELRPEDQQALQKVLRARVHPGVKAQALLADGYAALAALSSTTDRRLLCLIDPPFERGDEYDQLAGGIGAVLRGDGDAVVAAWTPLKDLETFDALLRRLEVAAPARPQVVEVRLRALTNPMRMNGCAMILLNAPDMGEEMSAAAAWIAGACGERGAQGRVWRA